MGNEVFWIKLLTNTFDNEALTLLESMPDGDTIIVIWSRMQLLAGKCNCDGYLVLDNNKPYSDEMLATVFRRPLNTTRLAIKAFLEFGMVEIKEETYFLPEWEKVQNIRGLEKIRNQTKNRVARCRAKAKSVTQSVTQSVTNSNDIETKIEKEPELEKTTTDHVKLLLQETPFSKISDQDLQTLAKRHGVERLLQVADVASETWRRNPEEKRNPGGYLQSLCESLLVPDWYVPHAERLACIEAEQRSKAEKETAQAVLKKQIDEQTAARNALWDSLSEQQRKKYLSEAQIGTLAYLNPPVAILAQAKLLAWDARLLFSSQIDLVDQIV